MEKLIENQNDSFRLAFADFDNTLNIVFTYDYISGLVELNWYDIFIYIEKGFLPYHAAIEYATEQIDENSNEDVVSLVTLNLDKECFVDSINQYVDNLSKLVPTELQKETANKIIYVILYWLLTEREKYNYIDLQNNIDVICADFGYPNILSNLCSYAKHSPKKIKSVKKPMDRLVAFLKEDLAKLQLLVGKK